MKTNDVTMVRIYLTEGETQLKNLLKRLQKWERLRGVTVFRGIAGFGDSGTIHDAGLIDLALDLPLVLEFFDDPAKIQAIVDHLHEDFKPGHIVTWPARVNV